jgi:serine/threonine protein phosphatase PrpC
VSQDDTYEAQTKPKPEAIRKSVVTVIEGKASIAGGRDSQQDFVWTGAKKEGTRWGVVADGHGPDGGFLAVFGGKKLMNEYNQMLNKGSSFADAARFAFNRVHSSLVAE